VDPRVAVVAAMVVCVANPRTEAVLAVADASMPPSAVLAAAPAALKVAGI
jgi:hypothetical protein